MNFIKAKIDSLKTEISDAAQKYYEDGSSPLTDAEFDEKVEELRQLDPDAPEVSQTGWGYDVNLDSTPGEKVKHKYGLIGSLDKVHNWKEFSAKMKFDPAYIVSIKLDGLSVVLYYEHGILIRALTRGDGKVGIDVTNKVVAIDSTLRDIQTDWTGAVRGEIIMPNANFDTFRKTHPEAKNARNSTAGLINSGEITDDLAYLEVVVYRVVGSDPSSAFSVDVTDSVVMETFLSSRFRHTAMWCSLPITEDRMLEFMNHLKDLWYHRYPADGIVISMNNLGWDMWTGEVTYNSVAYKFPAEEKETTVNYVEWNMSKTGYAIPRVCVKPVELAGTTVQFCTGFNAKYIYDTNIGEGAIVKIAKCGEIIPNILEVIRPAPKSEIPTKCPECGQPLAWKGVHLACLNTDCGNTRRQDISVWLENLAPVEGLKDALRFKYLEAIFGADNLDIEFIMSNYELAMTSIIEQAEHSGHAQLVYQMFNQLYHGTFTLAQAIRACNIPRFGEVTSDKLAKKPKMVSSVLAWPTDGFVYSSLRSVVGEADAESLMANMPKFLRLRLIQDRIDFTEPTQVVDKGRVAITGKLSVKRADFEAELKAAGYRPGNISKETKFLITDDPSSSSEKNRAADAWGITKITESEFRSKYLGGSI